jgi:hypothetical protein
MGYSKIVNGSCIYVFSDDQEIIRKEMLHAVKSIQELVNKFEKVLIGHLFKRGTLYKYEVFYVKGWGVTCKIFPGCNGSVYELVSTLPDNFVFQAENDQN